MLPTPETRQNVDLDALSDPLGSTEQGHFVASTKLQLEKAVRNEFDVAVRWP